MKARIFSLLLIVALLVSVCVFAVEAETYTVAKTAAELQTMHPTCPHCGATVTWERYDGRGSEGGGQLMTSKHWYFDTKFNSDAFANWVGNGAKLCIYFLDTEAGTGYINPSDGSSFVFEVAAGCEIALMGKGTVAGAGKAGGYAGGAIKLNDAGAAGSGSRLTIYHDVTVKHSGRTTPFATYGGAIYVGKYNELNIKGGNVVGGNAYMGGAIHCAEGATFTMTGGTVTGGTAKGYTPAEGTTGAVKACGGAISLYKCTANMSGGTIQGGTANQNEAGFGGGAVYVYGGTQFTMTGGTIQGTKAAHSGGSVLIREAGSAFNLEAGTVEAGTASSTRGGAFGVWAGGALTIGKAGAAADTAKVIFADDSAATGANGGLVFASDANTVVTINDGALLSGGQANGTGDNTGGGCIYSGATLNINGGTIQGGKAAKFGGNILLTGSCVFNMTGGTISGGEAVNGGNICLWTGVNATMTGGTIEGGYSNPVADEGDTIKTETADAIATHTGGGNIYIGAGATFTLAQAEGKTAEIKNGKADLDGGNIFVKNGKFQLDKGTVSGGQAYYVKGNGLQGGGNIYATDTTATVDINGGVVEGGQAIRGGNVAIFSGAKFTVDGDAQLNVTTPMANVAWMGANLFMRGSAITLTGGTFNGAAGTTNIEAGDYGGNIYVHTNTLTVDGATITDGKAWHGGNIFLREDASTKLVLTSGTISDGEVLREGGNIYINTNATAEINGGSVTGGKANDKDYGQGGGIQNTKGILKISGGEISGNVTTHNGGNIRMNGGTLEITGGTISGGVADVYGGNIVLQDGATATFTNGTIQNGIAWRGSNVFIHNGTFTMSQAEEATTQILGGEATHGSVYVSAGKTFTMNGGTISGGKAVEWGGNVFNAGIFDMNGGTITAGTNTEGNTVDGGNVYTSGTFTMDGGSITAGTGDYGANVEVVGGTFTMNAGTISGGAAAFEGGNVYVYAGEFIMNAGTTITGGTATTDGGNVLVLGGKFTMNDGTITAGKVEAAENGYVSGGNVAVEGGTFTMKAGAITNGAQNVKSSRGGGNVAVVKGTFTMEGGVISGGTTTGHGFGANLYVGFDDNSAKNNAPTVNLQGGEIAGNKTTGGNVLIEAGTLNLDGATVKDGKAGGVGGNIRVLGGTLNIKSGTVSGGTTSAEGGNLAIAGGAINISGGTITGGVAPSFGGNLATTGGTVTMTGGTITLGSTTKEEKADGISSMTGGGNIFMNGGTFNLNGENAKIIDGTTNVSGGNVYVAKGTFTLTKGTLANGEATYALGNGLQGGGNLYATSANAIVNINGGEIYGGIAKRGANIAVLSSATVTFGGTAEMTAADTFMSGINGPNFFTRQATLNVTGGTIDGGSVTATNTAGRLIYVHSGTINLSGGKFMNGMRNGTGVYLAGTAATTVELSGTADVCQMAIASGKTVPVNVKSDFAGSVYIRILTGAVHDAVEFNQQLPAEFTAETGYANTGSIFLGSKNYSYIPVAYGTVEGTTGLFTTKLTKLVEGTMLDNTSGAADTQEIDKVVGILSVSEVVAGETLSLAAGDVELTVTDDVSIDANGKSATVNAPAGKTVTLIDTANDDFKTAPGVVTVTGGAKVETDVKTEDGKRYIVVASTITPGTYSAHRISARLHKVSIRPRNVGVYYSVEIKCDSTLEKLVENYGVAMSIKSMPDDSFLDVENGRDDIRYTYISVTDKSFQSGEYHGALLDGIMGATDKDGNVITDEANAARARLPVYANAYVMVVQDNGTATMIMADEVNQGKGRDDAGFDADTAIDWTLTEIMEVVNNTTFNKETTTDQARASVQKFYNDWKTIAQWNFATIENWVKEGE